jgi:hypothetical protein
LNLFLLRPNKIDQKSRLGAFYQHHERPDRPSYYICFASPLQLDAAAILGFPQSHGAELRQQARDTLLSRNYYRVSGADFFPFELEAKGGIVLPLSSLFSLPFE